MGRFNIPENNTELTPEEVLNAIRNNDGHNSDYNVEMLDGVPGDEISVKTEVVDLINNIPVNESSVYLIGKPEIITPLNGVTGVIDNTIVANTFKTFNNYEGPHTASDWEVALEPEFTNIIDSSYNDTNNLTTWSAKMLTNQVVYYVRVRYISDYHVSEWSDYVKFTTGNLVSIDTPLVSVEGAPNNVSRTPIVAGSVFNAIGGYEEHKETDWRIENSTGDVIWESLNDINNLRYITIPPGVLDYNGSYTFKIRYRGINLESDWGSLLASVHPEPFMIDPEISIDGDPGAVNTAPILNGSPFLIKYDTDVHVETNWIIEKLDGTIIHTHTSTSGDLTYHVTPPNLLTVGNSYVFKMRYVGAKYTSNWVSKTVLINLEISVKTPTLTVDGFGDGPGDSDIVTIEPEIVTSSFEVLNGFDTHQSTDWYVYKTSDLNNPVWSSIGDTVNLTSIKLPDQTLEYNTAYRFAAVHNSNNYTSPQGRINKVTRKRPRALDPVFISPDPNGDLSALPQDFILELDNDTGNIILYNDPNTAFDDFDVGTLDKIEYTFTAIQGESVGEPSPKTIEKTSFSETIGYYLTMGTTYRLDATIYGTCDVPGTPEVSLVSNTTSIEFTVDFNVIVSLPIVTITKDANGDNEEGNGYDVITATGTAYSDNTNGQAQFFRSIWTLYDVDGVTVLATKTYTKTGIIDPPTTHSFTNLNLKADGVYTVELTYVGFLNNVEFYSQPNTDTVHTKIPPAKIPIITVVSGETDVEVDDFRVLTYIGDTIPTGLATHITTILDILDSNNQVVYSDIKTLGTLTEIDIVNANLNFDTTYTISVRHILEYNTNGVPQQITSDPGTIIITTKAVPSATISITGDINRQELTMFNVKADVTDLYLTDMTDVDSFVHTFSKWDLYYLDPTDGVWKPHKTITVSDSTGTNPGLRHVEFDIQQINQPPFAANEINILGTWKGVAQLDYGFSQAYRVALYVEGTVSYINNTVETKTNNTIFTFNGADKPYFNVPEIFLTIDSTPKFIITFPQLQEVPPYPAPDGLFLDFYKVNPSGPDVRVMQGAIGTGVDWYQQSVTVSFDDHFNVIDDTSEYYVTFSIRPGTLDQTSTSTPAYVDLNGEEVYITIQPHDVRSNLAVKDPPFTINPINITIDEDVETNVPGRVIVTVSPYSDNKAGIGTTNAQLTVSLTEWAYVKDSATINIANPTSDTTHQVTLTDSNPVQNSNYSVTATYTSTNNGESDTELKTVNVGSIGGYSVTAPSVNVTNPLSDTNKTQIDFTVSAFNDSEGNSSNFVSGLAKLYKDSVSTTPIQNVQIPTASGGSFSFINNAEYQPGTYYIIVTYDGDNGTFQDSADSPSVDAGTIGQQPTLTWTNFGTILSSERFAGDIVHKQNNQQYNVIMPGGSTDTGGGNVSSIDDISASESVTTYTPCFSTSQSTPIIDTVNRYALVNGSGTNIYLIGGLDQDAQTGGYYSSKIARWRGTSVTGYYFDILNDTSNQEASLATGRAAHAAWLVKSDANYDYFLVSGGIKGTALSDVLNTQEELVIARAAPFNVTVNSVSVTMPKSLASGVFFKLNGNLYYFGGRDGYGTTGGNKNTYRIDPVTYQWTTVTTTGPNNTQGGAIAIYNNLAILTGGYPAGSASSVTNEVWIFDGSTWTRGNQHALAIPDITDIGGAPYNVAGHASTVFIGNPSKLVIFGGGTFNGSTWSTTKSILKLEL